MFQKVKKGNTIVKDLLRKAVKIYGILVSLGTLPGKIHVPGNIVVYFFVWNRILHVWNGFEDSEGRRKLFWSVPIDARLAWIIMRVWWHAATNDLLIFTFFFRRPAIRAGGVQLQQTLSTTLAKAWLTLCVLALWYLCHCFFFHRFCSTEKLMGRSLKKP